MLYIYYLNCLQNIPAGGWPATQNSPCSDSPDLSEADFPALGPVKTKTKFKFIVAVTVRTTTDSLCLLGRSETAAAKTE